MKALVVVDYQTDFVTGTLGSKYAQMIEKNIVERLEYSISQGYDIFFTITTHKADYHDTLEGKKNPTVHCIEGTEGHSIYGKVGRYEKYGRILRKSSFGSLEIYNALRVYDHIELCGTGIDTSILTIAALARTSNPEATIEVRQNCVTSYDSLRGEEALDVLKSILVDVI